MRDTSADVVTLIFKQLTNNNTRIQDFSSKESRMLILIEGLTSHSENVRLACIYFLTPTILENEHDLSYIFKLVDCRVAFINEYYNKIPCLLVLAILQILPDESKLVTYLHQKVMAKLTLMAVRPKAEQLD